MAEADFMKARWTIILFTLTSAPSILAQGKSFSIALSAAWSTPAAFLLENFPKVGCPN
jgi:hypothetical protein